MTSIAIPVQYMAGPAASSVRRGAPMRVRTRLTRRGRVVIATLLLLPALVGGAVLAANASAVAGVGGSSSASFRHVIVQPGDSLWEIAQRVAPTADPRDVINAIIDLNGLQSSTIQAGERLAIPYQYDH